MMIREPHEQLSVAIKIAAEYHMGQFDKGGKPYILHTLKVMHYLKEVETDYELDCIAVLHDIVEDTAMTYSELTALGFSDRVRKGIQAMTKLPGQTPAEYEAQVSINIDAVKVKLADLRHNSDIRRIKGLTEKDVARVVKYMGMYDRLKKIREDFNGVPA